MNLILKNSKTGETKAIKAGWSWILFLFSSFLGIPLFMRKLYVWGAIFLTLWIINSVVPLFLPLALATAFSIGIMLIFIGLQVFMGIKGNEMTAKNYLENGWSIADPESELTKLAAARLGISVQLAMPEKETQSVNLTALCVSCGQEIVRQAKFCKHCGSSQQKTDQISTPAEPHFAKATVLHHAVQTAGSDGCVERPARRRERMAGVHPRLYPAQDRRDRADDPCRQILRHLSHDAGGGGA